MSAPRPLESEYLADSEVALNTAVLKLRGDRFEARLQILEACAARFGGFNLSEFQVAFRIKTLASEELLLERSAPLAAAIEASPIHPALALSALGREALEEPHRRSTGAYHTDFRLAQRLADLAADRLTYRSKVIDPACGAGILLAALSIAVCGRDRSKTREWLGQGVFAADLSASSLRATLLSLASLTDDLPALTTMRRSWLCGDSLLAGPEVWAKLAPGGFDAVIGNPPWEKVKLSRHEFLRSAGADRHYGAETKGLDVARFNAQRNEVAEYSRRLLIRYPDLAQGGPDLYVAFTALFFDICRPGGVVAALLPGGLIRSQGTENVRQKIFRLSQEVLISVIDNRARFFSIDTRFKFLIVVLIKAGSLKRKRQAISLLHEVGTRMGLQVAGSATVPRSALAALRKDLSLPEVRSESEWKVFLKIAKAGCGWDDPAGGWNAHFCREVDMTKERPKFLRQKTVGALPVVEGRMVHHHRFGVKGYVSGTGRAAVWRAYPIGASELTPQFWIEPQHIPLANRGRANVLRVGFCDIAGQTNERSLMAALIPPGVISGNKVPTIVFPDDPSRDRLLVWAAIANSLPFDWMLRRVITTTVNYFLLQSIPLPRLAKGGLPWRRLVAAADELMIMNGKGGMTAVIERVAQLRAEIDAEVAVAYGLTVQDLALMLEDFPILDRGQPRLPGEPKSTVTRDTALAMAARRMGVGGDPWQQRAREARSLGARAYVPSEIAVESAEMSDDRECTLNG